MVTQSDTKVKHTINEGDILQALREKGVVEDVMKQLHFDSGGSGIAAAKPATHYVNKDEKVAVNLTGKKGIKG